MYPKPSTGREGRKKRDETLEIPVRTRVLDVDTEKECTGVGVEVRGGGGRETGPRKGGTT